MADALKNWQRRIIILDLPGKDGGICMPPSTGSCSFSRRKRIVFIAALTDNERAVSIGKGTAGDAEGSSVPGKGLKPT
jgi:hypothetical protein